MSANVYCTLRLSGVVSRQEAEAMHGLMSGGEHRYAGLHKEYVFDDVPKGNMSNDLDDLFTRLNLSWAWEWEGAHALPAGIEIFDARKNEWFAYATVDSEIMLRLPDASDPAKVQRAKAADNLDKSTWTVFVAQTAHEVVDLVASGSISEVDAANFTKRVCASN
jgi:hypothetical protein